MNKITALLPMKGHSERIPNKNMRLFVGRPLYHQVMESLLLSKYISEVVINTDSEVIISDAEKNFDRVRINLRPNEIRGDYVSMNRIISYDLSMLPGSNFLQTHSTNPLLTTETIDRAIEKYFDILGVYDSLFSVTRIQTRLYWSDCSPVNHDPNELLRTQDLIPVFEENSNIYIFSKRSFKDAGEKRVGLKPYLFEMASVEAIDIDEENDWRLAEVLYNQKFYRKKVEPKG